MNAQVGRMWVLLCGLLLPTGHVFAAPCGATMAGVAAAMYPVKWFDQYLPDGTRKFGIKNLFVDPGTTGTAANTCGVSCHRQNGATDWTPTYQACFQCHTNTIANSQQRPYPDWLQLDTPEKMKRSSYYLPGGTKAQAAFVRTRDGTMPPGRSSGWCDEIQNLFEAWILAGYPN